MVGFQDFQAQNEGRMTLAGLLSIIQDVKYFFTFQNSFLAEVLYEIKPLESWVLTGFLLLQWIEVYTTDLDAHLVQLFF